MLNQQNTKVSKEQPLTKTTTNKEQTTAHQANKTGNNYHLLTKTTTKNKQENQNTNTKWKPKKLQRKQNNTKQTINNQASNTN